MDAARQRALIDAGTDLAFELDRDTVLLRLLERARELTGARYAAIGVLDEDRTGLEQFLTSGVDAETRRAIGELPRGRGVLGLLISDPQPLRLADVSAHPESYGLPLGHPPMSTFLGVPIIIGDRAWGNLYLTEKDAGEFSEEDEETAVVLARWAAIALANARAYRSEADRRAALERTNRALETTTEIAHALNGVTDVDQVLELVVKRSRALLRARAAEVALIDGDELVITALAGEGVDGLLGARMPAHNLLAEAALRTGRAQRYEDIPQCSYARRELGARRALAMPLIHREETIGFLLVLDRLGEDAAFTAEEQRLAEAFAASAAAAVASAQQATDETLRRSIAASEAERRRWARELHDETLQELAALQVLLATARRSSEPARWRAAIDDAAELIGGGIHNLRALITELRPAALDELGVEAALESLTARMATQHGLDIALAVDLPPRLSDELESTIYRLVQEALTNVAKHAGAETVDVGLKRVNGHVEVVVTDDGEGFELGAASSGFGLVGMRERLALVRAELTIESVPGSGTTLRACIPVALAEPA